MKPWISEAKPVSLLNAELCFLLKEDFYFGPDRHAGVDTSAFTQRLSLPSFPRSAPSMVLMSELDGREDELSAYYQQVVELAIHHGLNFNSIRHHFWVRLWMWNSEEDVDVSFPWYDSYSEVARFLNALLAVESGEVDYDIEQGWEMEVEAYAGHVYIRQRNPDDDETYMCIRVPRDELVLQVQQVMARSINTIMLLTEAMGEDVWTSYVRSEPVFMKKLSP
jgi:hypothetical protein